MIVAVSETAALDVPSRAHPFRSVAPFRPRFHFLASEKIPGLVAGELEVFMLIFVWYSFVHFLSFPSTASTSASASTA
jgi:hypothetical protein